jgi:prepilin-type N-terminal cleavage/methylation domain-containing protein
MTRTARRGITLLEVLVALAILATSALAILGAANQSWRAIRAAAEADSSLLDASAFLEAVALWPREELDQRLGERVQHPWKLSIDRPVPTLYVVTLVDSSGRDTLLVTSLYRAEPPRAQ